MADRRVLAPLDFDSEVLAPIDIPAADPADVARSFARHIAESLEPHAAPPKVALVDVQILKAKTLTDDVSDVVANRDYLTVGLEANDSLVRVTGVIRFKVMINSISATMQTRETFAAGRSIGAGLANWLFPEPDPNNRDEKGNPRQGCGSFFGWLAAAGVGAGVGSVAGTVPGIVAFILTLLAAYLAVDAARQSKQRQKDELLTLVRLALVNAHGDFKYTKPKAPAKPEDPPKQYRHERYGSEQPPSDDHGSGYTWMRDE